MSIKRFADSHCFSVRLGILCWLLCGTATVKLSATEDSGTPLLTESVAPPESADILERSAIDFATGSPLSLATAKAKVSLPERMAHGKYLFEAICSKCHQNDAKGVPGLFPPLAQSDFLQKDTTRATAIVLYGLRGRIRVNGQYFDNVMPELGLENNEIADALTYVLNNFGNAGGEIDVDEVSRLRFSQHRPTISE